MRVKAAWVAVGAFALGASAAAALLLPLMHRRLTVRAVAGDLRAAAFGPARGGEGGAIAFWGDSLTEGKGAAPGHDFPGLVGFLFDREVANRGVGGETSRQIRDRMLARPAPGGPERAVIWAGRNDDLGDPASTEDNIRAMVEALPAGSRVLVLGILNGDTKRERRGGDRYAAIVKLNADLRARYGRQFVPIREALVAQARADDGDDQDAADADVVPPSLRSDALHLNDRGEAAVAFAVEKAMEDDGW